MLGHRRQVGQLPMKSGDELILASRSSASFINYLFKQLFQNFWK